MASETACFLDCSMIYYPADLSHGLLCNHVLPAAAMAELIKNHDDKAFSIQEGSGGEGAPFYISLEKVTFFS
jgi:hypothetical protein